VTKARNKITDKKPSTAKLEPVEEKPSHTCDLFSDTAFWTKFVS
jgi:hypothetical protein